MAKNKLEKLFNIFGWFVVTLAFAMILAFVIMFVMLATYKECNDINFEKSYCEKYRDF